MNSIPAQRDLQCALRQLRGLTSLSTMLAEWPAPDDIAAEVDGAEQSCLSLAVGGLPQLAELRLSRGGVRELTAAPLTWLELSGTEFGMQASVFYRQRALLHAARLLGMLGMTWPASC